jgi:hypothetical protein
MCLPNLKAYLQSWIESNIKVELQDTHSTTTEELGEFIVETEDAFSSIISIGSGSSVLVLNYSHVFVGI